ncbi:hypothetical protein niasHT_002472 [Heterodera trifolii]|uniref:Uncharacterized protein n=1 Tax=Heterodera trifolii TaxID=157864 RepID=A0ABD2LMJ7_9BILA
MPSLNNDDDNFDLHESYNDTIWPANTAGDIIGQQNGNVREKVSAFWLKIVLLVLLLLVFSIGLLCLAIISETKSVMPFVIGMSMVEKRKEEKWMRIKKRKEEKLVEDNEKEKGRGEIEENEEEKEWKRRNLPENEEELFVRCL